MVQEAEKLKNNCPLSLVVNSITMCITTPFIDNSWSKFELFIRLDQVRYGGKGEDHLEGRVEQNLK